MLLLTLVVTTMVATTAFADETPETTFQKATAFVLDSEGGYSDHVADTGGATNYGVTQVAYDSWQDSLDKRRRPVSQIELWEVKGIYYAYWLEARCYEIEEVSPALAIAHFDWAINAGPSQAMRTLQRCIGTEADGIWGPKTRAAFLKSDPAEVLEEYFERRERFYRSQPEERRDAFLSGWLNRLDKLRNFLSDREE
ncbi:MAG: glycosyl hydrolase 108 family protein [Candidatus Paceibacterota bacterium]